MVCMPMTAIHHKKTYIFSWRNVFKIRHVLPADSFRISMCSYWKTCKNLQFSCVFAGGSGFGGYILTTLKLACLLFHAFFQKGYWYWILILQFFWHTDTDTYSVFFKLNTDTDTSVFENHTGYWILVFSFCTGQVSGFHDFHLTSARMLPRQHAYYFFLAYLAVFLWFWASQAGNFKNLRMLPRQHA